MSERSDLLESIATTIKPYRAGEIPTPTAAHVERWVNQFTPERQLAFLREFDHVIRHSFIPKASLIAYMADLVTTAALTGPNPHDFWRKVNFLSIQKDGKSQVEMLNLLGGQLQEKLGIDIANCGDPQGCYIYLDDVIFTGNRAATDLEDWVVNHAPVGAVLYVITGIVYSGGSYNLDDIKLKNIIKNSGKKIKFDIWSSLTLENRKYYRYNADVLWPLDLPQDPIVTAYAATLRYPHQPRIIGGTSQMFSSEEGRQVLETEFLLAGLKIRSHHKNPPKEILKPLGFSRFGVGFGATIVTYRNCPNTCPLALWWGEGEPSGAMQWYPLLPRKVYE